MHRPALPGRASLFAVATLTFIATISLLAPPVVRAAIPLRSADGANAAAGVLMPCSQSAAGTRAPQLHAARAR